MRKVFLLLPDLHGGGAESLQLVLAHEFVRYGYEVHFVLMQARGERLKEAEAAFPVHDLKVARVRHLPGALARHLRRQRPDGVCAAIWPLTVVAPLALRLSRHRCPVVVSEHNMLSVQYGGRGRLHGISLRASMAVGYRLADGVVAVSSGVADDMSRLSGLSRKRFQVIHNPVSRKSPGAGALAETEVLWDTPPGGRIISVGGFKRQKNHSLLLRAFARLARPDARLMLLGAGEGEAALRALANELGLAHRVIFAGFRPDPTPFYATADLFVLSSDYEGFANVIVEALATGTKVVSTDCPSGPAEILEGGRHGTLVPVGDAEALATAMSDALDRPHDPDRLRARAAAFTPERAARAYLELLGFGA